VDAWTSFQADTRASRSQPLADASAPKTPDTSGRLSQPELLSCDQVPAFLKTSKDIAALGFPTCCKTWQDWVTERRGAWRQRVNAARLTSGKGSSSWPTISVNESKNSVGKSQEHRNSIPLGTMAVILHGQAAPASSSSLGSRQGLWQTPKATNADCPVIHNPQRSDGGQPNLAAQMVLEQQRQWMTPRACEAQNPPMGVDKRHHGLTHQVTRQWATPNACDHKGATTPEACKQWESRGQNLPEMVNGMWPTPASCTGNGDSHGLDGGSGARSMLPEDMKRSSGKLNPRWVETLMGLPIGWTMPSCTSPQTIAPMSCDFSAMELSRPPQSELSEFSLAS
jgi:hypothetical protein